MWIRSKRLLSFFVALAFLVAPLSAATVTPQIGGGISQFDGGIASQGGVTTDPAAVAWTAAVVAASGTVSAAQLTRVSTLISCYKTNNIWSIRDRTWLRASENTTQANLDIVNLQTSTPHGTLTFTAGQGYTSNGTTGYIDTGYIPSTAGGNLTLNSATIGAYIITNDTSVNNRVLMGVNSGGSDFLYLQPLAAGGSFWENNGITFPNVAGQSTTQGFWVNSRVNATTITLDKNGVQIGSAASNSGTLPTKSIFVGAFDDNGTPDDFSIDQWALDFIAGGLTPTQRAAESTCDNAYMASLSINVYASAGTPAAVQSTNLASIFSGHAGSTLPAFGINTHIQVDDNGAVIPPTTNLAMAQTLGVTLVRADFVPWQTVEASAGVYSFTASDPYITGASGFWTAGMTVQLIHAYSNTLYESTIQTGPTDTAGKTAFANYAGGAVGSVVPHYGTTRMIYETPWQEENIGCGVAGNYSWSLSANATDYSALVNVVAPAIIARTVGAKLITGGVAPTGCGINPVPFGTTMNTAITVWANYQGAALHPYQGSGIPEQSIADSAAFAAAVTNAAAIYWSEVGYSTVDVLSETVKAQYDTRLALSAVIAQVKQIILYQLASCSGFGLFDCSFNILPAGTAYKNFLSAISGCTTIDALQYSLQSLWEVTCHIAGGVRRIVWSASSTFNFVSNESSISAASAVDLSGATISTAVNGNSVSFIVPGNGYAVVLAVTN